MNLQQSLLYQKYILALKWQVIDVDGSAVFIKHIPFLGALAKLQRVSVLPDLQKIHDLIIAKHIKSLVVEPEFTLDQQTLTTWCQQVSKWVKIASSPYIPTKTIMVDLTPDESSIFAKFSEAKRRAVRRAEKNKLIVRESHAIDDLIKIKNRSAGLFGAITTYGVKELWQTFGVRNTTSVLCYNREKLVGGVLLLFHDSVAYYWVAGATKEGKKLAAPTLLVWEAIKVARNHGAAQFDFVGVWDERIPKENHSWLGFTKFKEGFGGKSFLYPIARKFPTTA